MKLSKNFSMEEAVFSETASRLGIDNTPDKSASLHILYVAHQLESIRESLGVPIHITSWYRGEALNASIPGSSKTSAHITGYAVDCHVLGLTALELCIKVEALLEKSGIKFDQIIHEYGSWMHISFDPRNRGQCLTIFKNNSGKKYITGLLTKEQYNQ